MAKKSTKIKIAIIDSDLLGRKKHRFPNLVCEKLSAYWKEHGAEVHLALHYEDIENYDEIYISKVFTDTWVPEWIQDNVDMEKVTTTLPDNIHIGGTGFFFDKAPDLPYEIEHHMPDYHLYDDWIENEVNTARENYEKADKHFNEKSYRAQFKEYTDYSIGFTTRGCFRKCPFCVNRKYNHVFLHSPLSEFYDESRKKICLLDDNVLGCSHWRDVVGELINVKRPFKFKQGMDERILTEEKCEMLFNAKYDGDFTFAFDNIEDYDIIHEKIKLIRKYSRATNIKFYVLVGFESTGIDDIENMWKRVELLMRYQCLPYIMRYQDKNYTPWKDSKYRGMYVTMARWCNQPNFFKKKTFREYCEANQALVKTKGYICSSMRAMNLIEEEYPEIANKYFDLRFSDYDGTW